MSRKKRNSKFTHGSEAYELRQGVLQLIMTRIYRGQSFSDLQGLSIEEQRRLLKKQPRRLHDATEPLPLAA